jgi:hypothetical protein
LGCCSDARTLKSPALSGSTTTNRTHSPIGIIELPAARTRKFSKENIDRHHHWHPFKMNEQQLQQILTIQQAIAAAATAAMINTLLNPQQAAANLVNQNTLTESPTTPNTDFQEQDTQDHNNQTPTPTTTSATATLTDNNHHHHQQQQQLHHHHQQQQRQDNQVAASLAAASAAATSSNMMISQVASQSPNNHSNKKLKRHNNQAPQTFSRQHSSPSSSSAFLPDNVGLPRKLVRGQDVWLGRGAEQTRQILKCK